MICWTGETIRLKKVLLFLKIPPITFSTDAPSALFRRFSLGHRTRWLRCIPTPGQKVRVPGIVGSRRPAAMAALLAALVAALVAAAGGLVESPLQVVRRGICRLRIDEIGRHA